jgi:hypothetical protein
MVAAAPAASSAADPSDNPQPQPFVPSGNGTASTAAPEDPFNPTPKPFIPTTSGTAATEQVTLPAATTAAQTGTTQPDATGGPAVRIWLSSTRTEAEARAKWQGFQATFPDLFGRLQVLIKKVDLGDEAGVWFRVFGGPLPDRDTAQSLCGELMSRSPNDSCMVVVN